MLQPIDAGIGSTLKRIMGFVQDEWLESDENLRAWEGDPDATVKLDASARRILITRWAGEAWERLTTEPHYKDSFYDCFARTGAGLTADGTDDELIIPCKGLKDYKVPISLDDESNNIQYQDDCANIAASNENEDDDDEIIEKDTYDIIGEEEEEGGDVHNPVIFEEEIHTTLITTIAEPVSEILKASEKELEDDLDEDDSWKESLATAASMKIAWEISDIPCAINSLNTYALVYHDKQWDLVKIVKQINDNTYRYKLESSYQWAENQFDLINHGRYNTSSNRWVALMKKAIRGKK